MQLFIVWCYATNVVLRHCAVVVPSISLFVNVLVAFFIVCRI